MSHPYYDSEQWKALREIILNRDSHTCRKCNKAKATEVHHLHYRNWMDEKPSDLIAICRNCHQEEHSYSHDSIFGIYDSYEQMVSDEYLRIMENPNA